MERDGILIFHSIHRVMRAEKELKSAGFDVRLLPVPRELSSDCGLSLAFRWGDWSRVRLALDVADCSAEQVYQRDGGGYVRVG
ncbi:MAG TPA: DUF3343 domain-containing protein [Deferrisomatales bacterium]|nr:DUF3343 domain-containing protein [Deferrisomatales bacterium]